jgi:phage major head subunit gpT-like protein
MNISAASLDALYYGFNFQYQQAFLKQPTYYQRFSQTIPSSGRENRYAWVDRLPRAREWLGERQVQNLSARGYTLVNRDWELTDELDRNTVMDDQYGIFGAMNVPMMAMQAKLWQDQLLVDALQNGDSSTDPTKQVFDGQPFYSTAHPINIDNTALGTYSNLFTGVPLTAANFQQTRATMIAYVGADNRPIGVMPNLLVVPPQLELQARQILQSSFIAPAATTGMNVGSVVQSNVLVGMCDLLVHPYLANDATHYYLLDVGQAVKPFIMQLRQAPLFVFKNKPDDANLFYRKKFVFGVDMRGAAGFTLPYFAAKCGP